MSIFIDKIIFINESGAMSVHWLYIYMPFDRLLAALVLIKYMAIFGGNLIIKLSKVLVFT